MYFVGLRLFQGNESTGLQPFSYRGLVMRKCKLLLLKLHCCEV